MKDFLELTHVYFGFLISEFNFKITHEEIDLNFMGNATVRFETTITGIEIVLDRSEVSISIGQIEKDREYRYEFSDVVHSFAPQIVDVYTIPNEVTQANERVEFQLKRLAELLKLYGYPLLSGDFSMEKNIKTEEEKRVAGLMENMKRLNSQFKDSRNVTTRKRVLRLRNYHLLLIIGINGLSLLLSELFTPGLWFVLGFIIIGPLVYSLTFAVPTKNAFWLELRPFIVIIMGSFLGTCLLWLACRFVDNRVCQPYTFSAHTFGNFLFPLLIPAAYWPCSRLPQIIRRNKIL